MASRRRARSRRPRPESAACDRCHLTTCITAFKVFDTVVVLTRGGPLGRSEVLLYAMYLEGFQYFRIGYAAALTLVFLALVVTASAIQSILINRKVHYG